MPQYNPQTGRYEETEEERRKREADEAAAAGGPSFLNTVGQALSDRFDQKVANFNKNVDALGNAIADPQQAIADRLKSQIGIAQPQPTMTPAVPEQLLTTGLNAPKLETGTGPTQIPPGMPIAPEQLAVTTAPQVTQAPMPVPTNQPIAPGAAQPQPQATTAPTPAPAVQAAPQWQQDLASAQGDIGKYAAIASNPNNPQEAKTAAINAMQQAFAGKAKQDYVQDLVKKAGAGDLMAQNELIRHMKPETERQKAAAATEATTGDYIRAYLYGRLGMDQVARQYQDKITGQNIKHESIQLNGHNYAVQIDPKTGKIASALDENGVPQEDFMLNKLQAGGAKFGSHAFGFTGGSLTIPEGQPNAGQEYRQRTNSINGTIENIITTGPNRGQVYEGAPGLEKRVETNAAVKLNDAAIDFRAKPSIAAATTMLELAAKVDDGKNNAINNTLARIKFLEPAMFTKIGPLVGDITGRLDIPPLDQVKHVKGEAVNAAPAPQQRPGTANAAATAVPGVGIPQVGSLTQQLESQKAGVAVGEHAAKSKIDLAKEVAAAEQVVPAKEKGTEQAKDLKNQYFADNVYSLMQPIANEIKKSTGSGVGTKVDQLAALIGSSPTGAQAIAKLDVLGGVILQNVPRFEGAQSDADVKAYKAMAGDLANGNKPVATRLAALDGLVMLMKKYDKAGNNDWSFGSQQGAGAIKIIKREKVQ